MELLVVIAIIGVLVALLLPAMQAARESARAATCKNHLKQIGIAVHMHLDAHHHFPTGGWGYRWTGDPDRGFDKQQPGGWVYSLLPYVEQENLHALGAGLPEPEKNAAAAKRISRPPLPLFTCPTRRPAIQYPAATFAYRNQMSNSDVPSYVTRGDYAINVGHDRQNTLLGGGPKSMVSAESYSWPDPEKFTGVSFVRSEVNISQVIDGMTKTFLVGEKYVMADCYDVDCDRSDWGHIFGGFSEDTFRMAGTRNPLHRDEQNVAQPTSFGSAHAQCHFVFCDGSVRAIDYQIDPSVYEAYGNRNDGEVIALSND